MKNKHGLWLLILFFLFCSCRTINHDRAKLGVPPSLVYFSFDDGPNATSDTTARLLDVLKKYQITAFFCLLGVNADYAPDLVRLIHNEGHYIVNHGYSDKWVYKMGEGEFRDNLLRGEAAISAALGFDVHPKLYRPHGGFYSAAQEKIIQEEGYTVVPATVRVYDAVIAGAKQRKVVRQVIRKLEKQGGGIILLHDQRDSYSRTEVRLAKRPHGVFDRSWSPAAVEELIPILLDKGFILNSPDIFSVIRQNLIDQQY